MRLGRWACQSGHHDPGYEETGIYRRGESAASMLLPDFSVAVATVFDADWIKSQ
jgi:hypothetical protein